MLAQRAFGGRDTPPAVFLVAPLVWLIALRVPAFAADINLRVMLMTLCQITCVARRLRVLARARRAAAVALAGDHRAAAPLRSASACVSRSSWRRLLSQNPDFFRSPTFAVMAFGTVLFTITFAFLLLSMTKERGELRHKTAALVDPLTGLANRRAFLNDAEALIASRASRSEPLERPGGRPRPLQDHQ